MRFSQRHNAIIIIYYDTYEAVYVASTYINQSLIPAAVKSVKIATMQQV